MLALAEYEAGVHETCGLHDSIAKTDPLVALEDDVCPLCADIDAKLRARASEEHEAEGEDPGERRPGDGRRSTLRLLSPVEVAQRAVDAAGRRSDR